MCCCQPNFAQEMLPNTYPLIPLPVKLEPKDGFFELTPKTVICAGKGTGSEAKKLAAALRTATGFPLPIKQNSAAANFIQLQLDRSLAAKIGPEGYRLSVHPQGVTIHAAEEAGLFYGGITFRQMLPALIASTTKVVAVSLAVPESVPGRVYRAPPQPIRWAAPCAEIEDYPRFQWRGLLLDVARHHMPLEFIKKFVDVMAWHKLNTLQIHFTDDQGWRLEIKKLPRLTQVGAVRKESPRPGDRNQGDGVPYGPFFYPQAQIRELVAYAQARHVTIVPEIEMPGHFLAALAAYPEYSCRGGPFEVRTRWGIEPDILCPGKEQSFSFVLAILTEVIEMFPSRFIHIGGDEAPRIRWKECPHCQARIKAEGLKNEAQLQTYFNHRVENFLNQKGRRLIGWDEILEGGLTAGAAVMSWRGTAGGIAAAAAGHDVVMSPTSHCYFDYAQARGPGEPESIGGFIPLPTVYGFEPIPANLAEAHHKHILGAQGNLWTEFIWTPPQVEYFAYPRATALAEVVWSPATQRNYDNFTRRLAHHLERLEVLKVNYRKPEPPAKEK
jgi:hexosaminidase